MNATGFACPFCNHPTAYPVDVHGHVQCSVCHTNVDPCCGGVVCTTDPQEPISANAD